MLEIKRQYNIEKMLFDIYGNSLLWNECINNKKKISLESN